jgi:long-chain fatty acid transport protein
MKRSIITTIVIAITLMTTNATQAGGLNRIGGMGQRAGGMSGAYTAVADSLDSLFFYNPAGMSQFDITVFDTSMDIVMPTYHYKDRWGHKHDSKSGEVHVIPSFGIVSPLTDRLTIGLGVTNPYAQAAAFGGGRGIPRSETLISLTNITPAVSLKLRDNLFLGVGLNIGWAQFKYVAPFDVGGHFLPIGTDNETDGYGLGYTIGLMYRPNAKWTIGLTYMSELKADLNGETNISVGPLQIHDKFDMSITFPPRLGFGLAYQASNKLLLSFDANWYGYSKTFKSISLDFDKLPLVKTNDLKWKDNYSLHFGARYNINPDWIISGGVGYQTAAVPDSTINTLTPDVTGWDVSLGIEYQHKDFSAGLTTIYGWGSRDVKPSSGALYPGEYKSEVLSVTAGFQWRF